MFYFLLILFIVCSVCLIYNFEVQKNEDWWVHNTNKNFPMIWKGKTIWYSRSVAVVGFSFAKNTDDEWFILANKRGNGTPDYQGLWNVPCGYLDFNEDGETAVVRETFEETGISFQPNNFILYGVDSKPTANRQNVTLEYFNMSDVTIDKISKFTKTNSEQDEVDDIKWIKISEIDSYEWAFGHKDLIKHIFNEKIFKSK